MEKLKQGDYVTNLTKEQFDELYIIGKCTAITWETNKQEAIGFKEKSLILSVKGRLNHTPISQTKQELPFEVFKERAINTFKK